MAAALSLLSPKRTKDKTMDVGRIVSEIDAEIARLQQARAALTAIGASGAVAVRRGPGRPKGSGKKKAAKATRKRNLTPEGRKRIAEAMKRRWAERRAAVAKGSSKK